MKVVVVSAASLRQVRRRSHACVIVGMCGHAREYVWTCDCVWCEGRCSKRSLPPAGAAAQPRLCDLWVCVGTRASTYGRAIVYGVKVVVVSAPSLRQVRRRSHACVICGYAWARARVRMDVRLCMV